MSVELGAGALPEVLKPPEYRGNGTRTATDYRKVLSEADFAVFARLRTWRKQTAEREGIPPYAVFTNEQLADIAKQRVASLAALGEINGVGPARLERYGTAVLSCIGTASNGHAT